MSNVPDGWGYMPLGKLADIYVSNVDKKSHPGEIVIRLCNYLDVYNKDYLYADDDYMQATASLSEIERFHLEDGDVVITKDSETPDDIGIPAIIETSVPNLVCGYHLAILRCGPLIDPTWLAKQFKHPDTERYLGQVAVGTTRFGLGNTVLESIPILVAPLPEQRQVRDILRTVDDVIRHTEALIAKLKQIHTGLLHDLLAYGVDENGEARDPIAHPDQFKKSKLGSIPREWEVYTLRDVGDWLSGGTPSKSNAAFWGGTMPWVSPKDMKVFGLSDTDDHLTEAGATNGTRVVPPGTIFIVVRGMILAHTFPVCITAVEMAFNQDIKAITANEQVRDLYLAYWFIANSDVFLKLVTESTHGTKRLDLEELLEVKIAIPPSSSHEQDSIIEILKTSDARLETESDTLAKLRLLQQGLAADLLSGQVRVKLLPVEA